MLHAPYFKFSHQRGPHSHTQFTRLHHQICTGNPLVFWSPTQFTILSHKGALLLQPRQFTVSSASVIPLKVVQPLKLF